MTTKIIEDRYRGTGVPREFELGLEASVFLRSCVQICFRATFLNLCSRRRPLGEDGLYFNNFRRRAFIDARPKFLRCIESVFA